MIDVLCIGKYNGAGKFVKEQWNVFLNWCKGECNKLVIYSKMPYEKVCSKFLRFCNICEVDRPDEDLAIHAYEIQVTCNLFWDFIQHYNYNIDVEEDISHIYFFCNERYIAALEIVDYENYIMIEELNGHERIQLDVEMVAENIRLCIEGHADIDDCLQEEWRPLGEDCTAAQK